jgi:putative nucleotidyltransferase with HDIG domain/PAS domain S-box-containing protein
MPVLDQLPHGLFWKDSRLRYRGCNEVFLDRLGIDSKEDLLGRTDAELLEPAVAARYEETDRKVLDSGETATSLYAEVGADGATRWVETLKKPLLDGGGRTVGLLGVTTDVTGRVLSQRALRESEKLNRAVMEHSPIGISVREANGRLLYANGAWRRIWNLSRKAVEEDMAMPRRRFGFDDSDSYLGEWMGAVRRVYSEGGQLNIPELRVDPAPRSGTAEWVSHYYYAIMDGDGRVERVVVLTEDITRRKRNRQAALETAEEYRNLTRNLPVGIFRYSVSEGRLVRVNPALARMFGMGDASELAEADPLRLFAGDESRQRLASPLRSRGFVDSLEILLRRADGSDFWGAVSARAVSGEGQRLAYIDGTVSDVTRRKTATRKLEASLERLGRMTDSTVSAMSLLVDQRDPYTAGHQRQVARLAGAIASEMGMDDEGVRCVRTAGMLHDIGKMCVPSEILTKPGGISEMEYNLIKGHPGVGADILRTIDFPWPVADVVLQHHERLDGSGYPRGLRGTDIRLESRILAVADVVDAMASHRPYRPAVGVEAALELVEDSSGTLFDPEVVRSCLRLFRSRGFRLASYGPVIAGDPMDRLRQD